MRTLLQLIAATVLFWVGGGPQALAHDYTVGDLTIEHPWARPTVSQRQPGAAYFIIHNAAETDDRLIEARPVDFAEAAELHTHLHEDGIMRMRRVPDGIVIPAGETLAFEPGGLHVMLFGLAAPLAEGEFHTLTLVFENAGAIDVGLAVHHPNLSEDGADHHYH